MLDAEEAIVLDVLFQHSMKLMRGCVALRCVERIAGTKEIPMRVGECICDKQHRNAKKDAKIFVIKQRSLRFGLKPFHQFRLLAVQHIRRDINSTVALFQIASKFCLHKQGI